MEAYSYVSLNLLGNATNHTLFATFISMNDTIRRYLVSSLTTFSSTLFTVIGAQLMLAGTIQFNWAFFVGIFMVAVRSAFKVTLEAIPALGGHADK